MVTHRRFSRALLRWAVLVVVGSPNLFLALPAIGQASPERTVNLAEWAGSGRLGKRVHTKVASAQDPREVTLLGAIEIETSIDRFLDHVRQVELLAEGGTIRSVSRIHSSSLAEDVSEFALPQRDLRLIRDCEVSKCRIKLSAPLIAGLKELDQGSSTFREDVAGIMRDWLKGYLEDYLLQGDTTLLLYVDQEEPAHPAAPFQQLVASSLAIVDLPDQLRRWLLSATDSVTPNRETILFWSVEDTGLRPLTTVTQMFVLPSTNASAAEAWVAFKQLYASHYQLTSLKLVHVVEDESERGPVLRATLVDRRVFDNPVGGIRRAILEQQLENYVESRLLELRDALELPAPDTPFTAQD
jgi:hypothetical protein